MEQEELNNELSKVDLKKQLIVYYQEKVNTFTHEIVGAEAVARIIDSKGNILFPDQFIPYFEENNKILDLDFEVLRKVCKFIKTRIDSGLKNVRIASNFCRNHLQYEDFPERYLKVVREFDIPHELLELEITETVLINRDGIQNGIRTYEKLKKCGVNMTLDDFGTGYSSLALFQSIPLEVVKLDGIFLTEGSNKERTLIILKKITDLFHTLGTTVVAEYVETEEDEKIIKEAGITIGQGYFYSKPIPEDEFNKLLNKNL